VQTLTLNVEDNFLQDFLRLIEPYHDKIELQNDKNLEYDAYFYERQKQLQQDLEEVESGKAEMIEHDELWAKVHNHLQMMK